MLRTRLELQAILEEILGSENVYFQPPASLRMKYPCIVYERSDIAPIKADNVNYLKRKRYLVTVIDKDPDSVIPDKLIDLEYCNFDRHFVSNNLNHDVYTLYF